MTSIREALRQLLQRNLKSKVDIHDSDFSYAVHWIKQTREWGVARRHRVYDLVRDIIKSPDFIANEFERKYHIAEIDSKKYSGASLVALEKVLASLANEKSQKE